MDKYYFELFQYFLQDEIIEFDTVNKKYKLYKVEFEGEIDITDEQIANFRKELKQLPNKEF